MYIFGLRITIEKVDKPITGHLPTVFWRRRGLVRKVEAYCRENHDLRNSYGGKIGRIKALRSLTNCGLVEAKNWVELAFTENGYGRAR